MPEAACVGLVVPRFMLRNPYGEMTDRVDSFDFEEFTPQDGLSGMLWGNSAVIAGLLLGATFKKEGAKMRPGSVLSLGEMPFYYYTDSDGDQTALPCTERMLSSKMAEGVMKYRFMPMLSIKGQPEVRLGGFGSLTGSTLAGPWKPAATSGAAEPAQEEAAPEREEKAEPQEESNAETAEEPAQETASEPAEEGAQSDPELDKLLASLNEETAPAQPAAEAPAADESAEQPIDPELANLLKELG